jgi:hypothetical protein
MTDSLASQNASDPLGNTDFQLDRWDHLFLLDLHLDVPSQLIAIRELLTSHLAASKEFDAEIAQLEELAKKLSGASNERLTDEWVDRLHGGVYQAAAHSMSAVGMLAPFVESLFHQFFEGVGRKFFPATQPLTPHRRWDAAHAVQWDCHVVIDSSGEVRTDLVRGIAQLSDAIGLGPFLPRSLDKTLNALFSYRNKMFHNGLEWPMEERLRFAKRIEDESWPNEWFSRATSGDEPWIYYLSQSFIDHCLQTIVQILDGFSAFVQKELVPLIR